MRIRATAVVVKDGKLLMIHRFKNGEEYWVLPGGSVKAEEVIKEAVLRELKEETSIEAKIKEKLAEINTEEETKTVLYFCEYVSGELKLGENSEEVQRSGPNNVYTPKWIKISELPKLLIYPDEVKDFLLEKYT